MTNPLLLDAAQRAGHYLENIAQRSVFPSSGALIDLHQFEVPLPDQPSDPSAVLALLDRLGSPATVASAGPRYFGFVTGGQLSAALAANWLADAWDNNGAFTMSSPINAKLEEVALRWLIDLFGLPATVGGGFVTGATMANFTALAAARHALLQQQGWDVEAQGLFGAPPLTVVVGNEVHVSVLKALSLLGLGRERVVRVAVDDQGCMLPSALPTLDTATIVILQAGNVNTGACDPVGEICALAQARGAWVHVDGAFGMWAALAPARAHLVQGMDAADSWATDAHKWLNVAYDSGLVFCRHPQFLTAAMSFNAAYLVPSDQREPSHYTPELSRRTRGIEIWAALQSLGRAGLADLIERNCHYATQFATGLIGGRL